jgi:hypothetical protein
VSIQLQFAQHESKGVDFDLLNQDGTPGEHGGFVLKSDGFVLAASSRLAYASDTLELRRRTGLVFPALLTLL